MVLPAEVTFLTGAPGAGKGTNMALIQKLLGASHALGLSSELAKNSAAREFVQNGALVPESLVAQTLFDSVFNGYHAMHERVVIDGFPRSPSQVRISRLPSRHRRSAPAAHRHKRIALKLMYQ